MLKNEHPEINLELYWLFCYLICFLMTNYKRLPLFKQTDSLKALDETALHQSCACA